MRTREESLNNFTKLVGDLIETNYLLANSKIFEVITAVNTSKLLTETFKYFTDGFNFEEVLTNCFQFCSQFLQPQRPNQHNKLHI